MTPDELVASVAAALGRAPQSAAPPRPAVPIEALRHHASPQGTEAVAERVARFISAACAVGMQARSVTPEQCEAAVRAIAPGWDGATPWPRVGRDALFEAEVGITRAVAALAETGSVVLEGPAQEAFIPPVHVVLVAASQVQPSLSAYLASQSGREDGPSARVIVTGPSKTADIEGVLVTGVHGPGRVVVLVIGDGA